MTNLFRPLRLASLRWIGEAQTGRPEAYHAEGLCVKAIVGDAAVVEGGMLGRSNT
jgi:hypothetical protein